jgi:hypothetical protein
VRPEASVERQDALHGGLVGGSRLLVTQVVREVRADHDQRLVAAPQALEHLRHRLGVGVADDQRHEGEAAELRLQERQLDLERMLVLVHAVAANHLRQVVQASQRREVEGNLAQRRLESLCVGCRQAAERDAMRGAEQHDAADDRLAPRSEQGIDMRRHRAAVLVAGMRGDQQLGRHLRCRRPRRRRRDSRQPARAARQGAAG